MTADEQYSLLRHGQFMMYWATRVTTAFAYHMMFVAIGWQVYDLTNSALDLGLIGLIMFIPSVPGAVLVGHVADHYDRRFVVAIAQITMGLCALVLAIASVTGHISANLIFAAVLVIGVGRAFHSPTLHTLLPGIVPPSMISRGVAAGTGANQISIIGGPVLGGILYIFGPEVVYRLSAVFFIIATILVVLVRVNYPPREKKPISLGEVFAGFTYIRQNKVIFGSISLDLSALLLGGVTALLPIYARDILQTGPWGLGVLRAAPAVGAIVATIYLTRVALRRRTGHILIGAICVYGVSVLVFGVSTTLWLSILALIVYGAMDAVNTIIRHSMTQSRTPNDKLGRVMSVSSLFTSSATTLGQFKAGVLAALLGVVPSVLVGGVGAIAVALIWIRLFPELWRVQSVIPEKEEEHANRKLD
jgi:MFS family permease